MGVISPQLLKQWFRSIKARLMMRYKIQNQHSSLSLRQGLKKINGGGFYLKVDIILLNFSSWEADVTTFSRKKAYSLVGRCCSRIPCEGFSYFMKQPKRCDWFLWIEIEYRFYRYRINLHFIFQDLVRVFKDMRIRYQGLKALNVWAIEFLVCCRMMYVNIFSVSLLHGSIGESSTATTWTHFYAGSSASCLRSEYLWT